LEPLVPPALEWMEKSQKTGLSSSASVSLLFTAHAQQSSQSIIKDEVQYNYGG
jgi:mevalonate kinase